MCPVYYFIVDILQGLNILKHIAGICVQVIVHKRRNYNYKDFDITNSVMFPLIQLPIIKYIFILPIQKYVIAYLHFYS